MAINLNPLSGYKMSQAELRKTMGGKSSLYEFLAMYATRDVQMHTFNWDSVAAADLTNGEFWILEDPILFFRLPGDADGDRAFPEGGLGVDGDRAK